MFAPVRDASDCRAQWENRQTPLLDWSPIGRSEERELLEAVARRGARNWPALADALARGGGRRRAAWLLQQHHTRWLRAEAPWTASEDRRLASGVAQHARDWQRVAAVVGGARSALQCMHRWMKSCDPTIRRAPWRADEDARLRVAVAHYGLGRWALVARHLHGRRVRARARDGASILLAP